MEKNQLATIPKDLAEKLNTTVLSVIGEEAGIMFQKAYLIANATIEIKKLLTTEYMKPIMALQGSRLGFKTDKDQAGGYDEATVKNCLIEAVLTGVQPHGNQFNIIAGNTYITKEGFGYLLANFKGLSYQIIPSLPRINADSTSAAIDMLIKWTINNISKEQLLPIPVKMNKFMGTDAVIGKATRKARAWLFNTISGSEIADGDITESDSQVVSSKINKSTEEIESERMQLLIDDCKTIADLELLQASAPDFDKEKFQAKAQQLKGK